jgi:hypothetical protein
VQKVEISPPRALHQESRAEIEKKEKSICPKLPINAKLYGLVIDMV